MKLDFKLCKIKSDSKSYDVWSIGSLKADRDLDMILIGIEHIDKESNYQLIPIEKDGNIKLLKGLTLTDIAYCVPVEDTVISNKKCTLDIPKEFLTLEIVDYIHNIYS